jgi:hypothetical protein
MEVTAGAGRREWGSRAAVALASMLALMTVVVMIAAGALGLGPVPDLLSEPTMIAYMNGLALTIVVGQLPKLFEPSVDGEGLIGDQSTHSRVASSTSSTVFHGPRRRISSVLNRPMWVSARAYRDRDRVVQHPSGANGPAPGEPDYPRPVRSRHDLWSDRSCSCSWVICACAAVARSRMEATISSGALLRKPSSAKRRVVWPRSFSAAANCLPSRAFSA